MTSGIEFFDRPWIEKYRPMNLNEVVGNEDIVNQLRNIASQGNIPNLILAGPPGTGKTTSVMALARELLGSDFHKGVIELNASDERGIDTVRDRIKSFAAQQVHLPEGRHKVIILDEADAMTEQAQQALRVIISDFAATTRFALACNDSTKIIEPIQSRCCLLRFSKLSEDHIRDRLMKVVSMENIEYEDRGIDALVDNSNGDMRIALNNLQSAFIGYGQITHENVYKIMDIPKPEALVKVMEDCENGKFRNALDKIDSLYNDGFGSLEILNMCSKVIKKNNSISDQRKFKMIEVITQYKLRFLDGIDSIVQMYGFIADMVKLFGNFGDKARVRQTKGMDVD